MFGMTNINEMEVTELKELYDDADALPQGVVLLDVRTPGEYARGKLAGSVNVPLHIIPLKIQDYADAEKILIYCQ